MKRIFLAVFLALMFFAAPVYAKKVEINFALTASGVTSSTESLSISSISQDTSLFYTKPDSATGTLQYILADRGNIPAPCWSVQVTTATSAGDTTIGIGYKVINAEPSTAVWTAAPLQRIMNGVSTASGVSTYPVTFSPPAGKYLRFYLTSGTTAFTVFDARVIVSDNANCPEPAVVRLSVQSISGTTTAVSSFTEPDDAKEAWVNLVGGGPYRFTDSSVSGTSIVGQTYYAGDSLFFYGKNDIDNARFMLDSTATSGTFYVIYYGRP